METQDIALRKIGGRKIIFFCQQGVKIFGQLKALVDKGAYFFFAFQCKGPKQLCSQSRFGALNRVGHGVDSYHFGIVEHIGSFLLKSGGLIGEIPEKNCGTQGGNPHHFMGIPNHRIGFFDSFDEGLTLWPCECCCTVGAIDMKPQLLFLAKVAHGI